VNWVTWLGHSTVVIEIDGTRLITDPALRRRIWHLRRPEAVSAAALRRLDGVLVSHAHFDHLDLASLGKLDRSLPVVVPRLAGELVRRRGFARVLEVTAGDELDLDSLRIRATHAEHASGRGPFSPPSSALGYVVSGSVAVYFAGDTDLFDGMETIGGGELDLALLPIWGWGTNIGAGHLDPERAARAAALLSPRAVVPIHWGTLYPLGLARLRPEPLRAPAREFATWMRELAPQTELRVLAPGEATSLA
jgi:L-ascorbate metabolism protein UlaG (beta-lactamase superfamily)